MREESVGWLGGGGEEGRKAIREGTKRHRSKFKGTKRFRWKKNIKKCINVNILLNSRGEHAEKRFSTAFLT